MAHAVRWEQWSMLHKDRGNVGGNGGENGRRRTKARGSLVRRSRAGAACISGPGDPRWVQGIQLDQGSWLSFLPCPPCVVLFSFSPCFLCSLYFGASNIGRVYNGMLIKGDK